MLIFSVTFDSNGSFPLVHAGPAIVISFIIAAIVAAFAALCYSELAAMIPIAGSAYTYAYATMGEFTAWIIGWDLILEYMVGAAAVSVSTSGYIKSLFHDAFGVNVDARWTSAPFVFDPKTQSFALTGNYINLPAIVISLACTLLLVLGVRESARANTIVVAIKLLVVMIFIFATIGYVNPSNWKPFVPENDGTFGHFGWSGIIQGASVVFFAYIGFDAVSTTAQVHLYKF
jgi:APA family basic amino acid/polyamine antiporter